MKLEELVEVLDKAGWNEEIVNQYFMSMPTDVYDSKNDEEANAFFKAWFSDHIDKLLADVTRMDMAYLIRKFIEGHYRDLDEPYTSACIHVAKKVLDRQMPYHDNDHEWFAIQDAITNKMKRQISVIVHSYLASRSR